MLCLFHINRVPFVNAPTTINVLRHFNVGMALSCCFFFSFLSFDLVLVFLILLLCVLLAFLYLYSQSFIQFSQLDCQPAIQPSSQTVQQSVSLLVVEVCASCFVACRFCLDVYILFVLLKSIFIYLFSLHCKPFVHL